MPFVGLSGIGCLLGAGSSPLGGLCHREGQAEKPAEAPPPVATTPPLDPPLPAGWEARVSRTHGDTYYVNLLTNDTTYDNPTTMETPSTSIFKGPPTPAARAPSFPTDTETLVAEAETPAVDDSGTSILVRFMAPGPLGLAWRATDTGEAFISGIKEDSQAALLFQLQKGLVLQAVDGSRVADEPYDVVMKRVITAGRPLALEFKPPWDAAGHATVAAPATPRHVESGVESGEDSQTIVFRGRVLRKVSCVFLAANIPGYKLGVNCDVCRKLVDGQSTLWHAEPQVGEIGGWDCCTACAPSTPVLKEEFTPEQILNAAAAIGKFSLPVIIVEMLAKYLQEDTVQVAGLRRLRELAGGGNGRQPAPNRPDDRSSRRSAVQAEAAAAAVQAVKVHPTHPPVLVAAFWLLCVLSRDDDSCAEFGATALPVVASALADMHSSDEVAAAACAALSNLSVHGHLASEACVAAVVAAMRLHPDSESVAVQTCGALRNLSLSNPANCPLIVGAEGQAALASAAAQHSTCADHAAAAIANLIAAAPQEKVEAVEAPEAAPVSLVEQVLSGKRGVIGKRARMLRREGPLKRAELVVLTEISEATEDAEMNYKFQSTRTGEGWWIHASALGKTFQWAVPGSSGSAARPRRRPQAATSSCCAANPRPASDHPAAMRQRQQTAAAVAAAAAGLRKPEGEGQPAAFAASDHLTVSSTEQENRAGPAKSALLEALSLLSGGVAAPSASSVVGPGREEEAVIVTAAAGRHRSGSMREVIQVRGDWSARAPHCSLPSCAVLTSMSSIGLLFISTRSLPPPPPPPLPPLPPLRRPHLRRD